MPQNGLDGPDRLLERLHRAARAGSDLSAVPTAGAARLLRLDAVTLDLAPGRGAPERLWADAATPLGAVLDDLQYTFGEGPVRDCARTGRITVEEDLTTSACATRWPVFAPAAARTGARSVIALPLLLGVVTTGVLTGYRTGPGPFPADQQRDLTRFARIALNLLLQTPFKALTAGAEPDTDADAGAVDLHHAEVHQAAGIVSVHLGTTVDDALLRLRLHAWHHERPLADVAHDVTTGRLRLPPR